MFYNGPRMDEGDLAHPGPATIAGMTSLEVLFNLDHDCGRHRRLTWAHQVSSFANGICYYSSRPNYLKF